MQFLIDNVYTTVKFTEPKHVQKIVEDQLHYILDPLDPKRYQMVSFRRHFWDGRIVFYDRKHHRFLTGLLSQAVEGLKQAQSHMQIPSFEVVDLREAPIRPKEIAKQVRLKGDPGKPDIIMHNDDEKWGYQYRAMKFALENQRSIINISTGGGKTEVSAAVIKQDLTVLKPEDKILFLCSGKDLAYQTQARYAKRLDMEGQIGFWGDGHKEIKQITCGILKSIASALKSNPNDNKNIKLTRQKDKALRYMVTQIIPKFEDVPHPKSLLKTYLRNNSAPYAYLEPVYTDLVDMVTSPMTDQDILKVFAKYQEGYQKIIRQKNSAIYDKYYEAVNYLASVKVLVGDEFHHFASNDYQLINQYLVNARQRVGLTGTLNKKENIKQYESVVGIASESIFKVPNSFLISKGISAKPYIKLIDIDQPKMLEQIHPFMGNNKLLQYQHFYRLAVIENTYRNQVIANITKGLVATKKVTLIVVNSIEHGENIQHELDALGVKSQFLQGALATDARQELLTSVRKNETLVLIGTSLIDEGIDIPNLKYLIYASGGKSYRATLQRIGRVLRIDKNKKDTYIFDFVDRTARVLYQQSKKRQKYYHDEGFTIL